MEPFSEYKFSWTYLLAGNIRQKVFNDNQEIVDFFYIGDTEFQQQIAKPQTHTVLHSLIEHIAKEEIEYLTRKGSPDMVAHDWQEQLNDYKVVHMTEEAFDKHWETLDESADFHSNYVDYLGELMQENVTVRLADGTFQLLFGDRAFCRKLNEIIADHIKGYGPAEYPNLYADNGKLIRSTYFPVWVQKAVCLRDKGSCAVCLKDLSGLFRTDYKDAIDHIVPLNL